MQKILNGLFIFFFFQFILFLNLDARADVSGMMESPTLYVTSFEDLPDAKDDKECLASNGHCTLRAAIDHANQLALDVPVLVFLEAGTYCLALSDDGSDYQKGDLDVNYGVQVEIWGDPDGSSIISGRCFEPEQTDRLFELHPESILKLNNIILTDGKTNEDGGCFFQRDYSQLYLNGGLVKKCEADGHGGAIFLIRNASLFVNRTQFIKNRAEKGGAIYALTSLVELEQAGFRRNHALLDGGAIFFDASSALIERSAFVFNRAGFHGGALFIDDNFQEFKLHIENSTLAYNRAEFGGAFGFIVEGEESFVNLDSLTIAENQAFQFELAFFNEVREEFQPQIKNSVVLHAEYSTNHPFQSLGFNWMTATDLVEVVSETDLIGSAAEALLEFTYLPTPHFSLRAGSPLIDTGQCDLLDDQLGLRRDAFCDRGAIEYRAD